MISAVLGRLPYRATGYQMIESITIKNFRCFESLTITDCRRVNIIVGDNGAGKTALLEAMFMALGGSPEIAIRLRQYRGLGGSFAGSPRDVEDAMWGGYFYRLDSRRPILVILSGDGPEARRLSMSRSQDELLVPLSDDARDDYGSSTPIAFVWTDSTGQDHRAVPQATSEGLKISPSNEDLPNFFLFSATHVVSSAENAARFSSLSRERRLPQFLNLFLDEFKWIEDLSIEVIGGAPVIHATVKNVPEKIPLNTISGAINRMVGVMLAIASRPRSVILVDEVENGIYYKHHQSYLRGLLSFAQTYDSQLFLSTHSEEFLEALVSAAGKDVSSLAVWRMELSESGPVVRQFSGETLKAGIEMGTEVR